MKKILKITSLIMVTLFFVTYFVYLSLPYEKILKNMTSRDISFSAEVSPLFFGGFSFKDVRLKYPKQPLPLLSSLKECKVAFSPLSLLLGQVKISLSLHHWEDKNIGFDPINIENARIQTGFVTFWKFFLSSVSPDDIFNFSVISQLEMAGINLGKQSQSGYFKIEISHDPRGRLISKPLGNVWYHAFCNSISPEFITC